MNAHKKARVEAIRANTAYPTYRSIIGIITLILMILAGLQALGALILGFGAGAALHNGLAGFAVILLGLGSAALAFFLAKIWNEGAQILVDIGDSIMDANPAVPSNTVPPNAGAINAGAINTGPLPVSSPLLPNTPSY